MSLKDQITDQMKTAMKAREMDKLGALRFLLSEIKKAEIDNKGDLDDVAILAVVKRERKKVKDSIKQFVDAGRAELAENEQINLVVLEQFLPEEMGADEITKIVDEVIAGGADNFGAVMGQVMAKTKGQADGVLVKKLVEEKLG